MKKLFLLLCTYLALGQLIAQGPPAGGPPPANSNGPGRPAGSGPATGHLYGKVVDSTGHGIAHASVMILKVAKDPATGKQHETLLRGVSSQNNGDFSAEDLPAGSPMKLSITAVGYSPYTRTVILSARESDKDLGNLSMRLAAKELQQVVVTASKPTMTVDMEKKVFNVSKDLMSVGGNGLDVLKNVPSVNVDIDGNVTLRGGSPQLFVDGKPTTLTLDEIPSDAIESVEVITNPSAKYDASGGGAGILNIVLKKNRKTGYNGSVRAGVDRYGGANGGASLNVREGKINFSADLNTRIMRDRVTSSTDRQDYSTTPTTFLNQRELDTTKGHMYFGRVGLDYFLNNRTTISLTGFAMHHQMVNTSNISMNTDSMYSTGKISGYSTEEINGAHSFNGRGATLGFKQLFAKDKEEWTADASYFSGNATNSSLYTTNYFATGSGSALTNSQVQQIIGGGNDHNIILQTDFSDPITAKTKIEAGLRTALQGRLNINNNYTYNPDSNAYELIPSAASNYKSQSNVYAAYFTIASSIHDFTYKLGLRAESSDYHGTLLNVDSTFHNQYPISLFPSLFLGQKLGNNQELQLSYTRRVNRPNFFQLVPYTDSSNKLNITRGNPNLVPEFTQSVELSYLKTFPGNSTLMASVYYKYTDHLITGYIQADTNASTGTTTLINTFINAESSRSVGAELTGQVNITRWWDLSTNVNLYQSKINVGASEGVAQQALWSWFGKLNTSFRLPSGFSIQVSGMYQSKTNLPVNTNGNQPGPPNMQSQSASQGYIRPFYEADLALKKTFLGNKLAATLSFSDIFRSRWQDQYTYSAYFTQEYDRLRDPQMLRLNVSWNFGKVDVSLFKRKNNNVQSEDQ
ncbi:MAG TPA: TonB-dependent receptor [Puia sp.]|jgi:outer membrane receptor protein involved in Fe transport|nr:TonB-dependent receptor [Puia sp.]